MSKQNIKIKITVNDGTQNSELTQDLILVNKELEDFLNNVGQFCANYEKNEELIQLRAERIAEALESLRLSIFPVEKPSETLISDYRHLVERMKEGQTLGKYDAFMNVIVNFIKSCLKDEFFEY